MLVVKEPLTASPVPSAVTAATAVSFSTTITAAYVSTTHHQHFRRCCRCSFFCCHCTNTSISDAIAITIFIKTATTDKKL
jgi:hypothetical protein